MRVLLVDYALNSYVYDFKYRIDKAGPQFLVKKISENSNNLYVPKNEDDAYIFLDHSVKKDDAHKNS